MYEQLQSAFDPARLNAIQYSGGIILTLDHGVYETMGRCKHPGHADHDKWFFTTALLPIVIMGKQVENMLDVC